MDDIKAKQQVVEKIKEASKILVTVSNSPSVDALSAALGLTLLFDKQEKYATAIFSGEVPPAIAFLEPEKTFDETTDSLRDFIIALNKEKADHLRYKVEGDSVKIFITPYKTTIDKDDLEFSQGDYNVELVIALGVDSQDHLDKALEDHGQILHDATVITVSAGDQSSDLGGIDWHDANASSLSEMVAGLAEALKEDKKKPLVDATIATALLTGIVAQTDRFSNEHTTSKVMTVAAQLMSAGADQQLIATELEKKPEVEEVPEEVVEEPEATEEESEVGEDGSLGNISIHKDELKIEHDDSAVAAAVAAVAAASASAATATAAEDDVETLAELDERIREQPQVVVKEHVAPEVKHEVEPSEPAEEQIEEQVEEPVQEPIQEPVAPEPTPELEYEPIFPKALTTPIEPVKPAEVYEPFVPFAPLPPAPAPEPVAPATAVEAPRSENVASVYSMDDDNNAPSLGGTLNATSEQAAEDARREAISGQNKTILSHAYLGGQATQVSDPIGETPVGFPGTPPVAPGSVGINTTADDEVHSAYALSDSSDQSDTSASNSGPTFGVGGERVIAPLPQIPVAPTDLGLPLPPPLPDFSQGSLAPPTFPPIGAPALPPVSPFTINPEPTTQTEILGDILAPEPNSAYSFEEIPIQKPSNDPGQFKIPG